MIVVSVLIRYFLFHVTFAGKRHRRKKKVSELKSRNVSDKQVPANPGEWTEHLHYVGSIRTGWGFRADTIRLVLLQSVTQKGFITINCVAFHTEISSAVLFISPSKEKRQKKDFRNTTVVWRFGGRAWKWVFLWTFMEIVFIYLTVFVIISFVFNYSIKAYPKKDQFPHHSGIRNPKPQNCPSCHR